MHAVRLHTFGPAENLTYEKVEDPRPTAGQVRIAVAAAGVHLVDTAIRAGEKGPLPELPALPTVPGREVAGTVESVGAGVSADWLGKRVVTHIGFAPGGYAELTVTDEARLHELPEGLDFAEAVALIGTGRTTMGILQFVELDKESVVVIPAAAGGIGTLLVQYAKHAGATVVGLAGGPAKVARVRDNGADLAVDYTDAGWPDEVRAYLKGLGGDGADEGGRGDGGHADGGRGNDSRTDDSRGDGGRGGGGRTATVVFDGVGGAVGRAAVELLGAGGTHVTFGWSGKEGPVALGEDERAERGITQVSPLGAAMLERAGGENPVRVLELAALGAYAEGYFTPSVQRFPLREAAAAHRALESRGTSGKVVLIP
ncbi:zinc-binding dehydrogenase [Streptomyces flavofungini]|uniref:Zinc-binding dehydrogenase n=1 Tax=Streptomyces flavofungini TaxID=68200 RepID=A0ABS0X1J5_9ACTN|nr:zinc-binding dehydrogenase [Streptomyces flavofungini]MBJ3806926.1 zinc-binding dehydrogenase [Streptomyces flavofungini]GHC59643.1 oxidoreductase [Streptomyces flavofungini]